MKLVIGIIYTTVLLVFNTYGQIQLKGTLYGSVSYLGDIDNDLIGEFVENTYDTVRIYDAATLNVKYVVEGKGYVKTPPNIGWWTFNNNPFTLDFNGNGVKDLWFGVTSSSSSGIIDPFTNEILFEVNSLDTRPGWVGDFDNDGLVEFTLIYSGSMEIYDTGLSVTGLDQKNYVNNAAKNFSIEQNYPNPFNPTTTINYYINKEDNIDIKIYDNLGELVKTLVNEYKKPGEYQVIWDGKNDNDVAVSSGVYYYQLITEHLQSSKKMILLK